MKTEIIVSVGQFEHIKCLDTDDDLNVLVDTHKRLKALTQKPGDTILKPSFNEEDIEVEFDEVQHKYFHKGKNLTSATTYIKKFYKPFNAELIAKNCEKSWKVPAKEIQAMWKSNGQIASSFGTVVHNALEHYDTHKAIAETIEKNAKKKDVALPKHPFLQEVIKSFYALDSHFTGQVVPEALITDVKGGYCGHADRVLITGDKTCRIQDYKVNIDANKEDKNEKPLKPYETLPPTKLTKYRLQMSFYANMLQKSGWTVEGLDAFVYEDEWKHYQLEPLSLI
jgi:hypothetical protein